MTNLEAALEYASQGWPVVPLHTPTDDPDKPCTCRRFNCPDLGDHPCHKNTCKDMGKHPCHQTVCESVGKHPRTKNGVYDATTDEETIRNWWKQWPDANVGGAMGAKAGRWALDVDPRNGGGDTLASLTTERGKLPVTRTALTGGIGNHYIFKWPEGFTGKLKDELGPGLDVKADGGLIVLAPSRHVSGNTYRWLNNAPLADAPSWMLDKLREVKPSAAVDVGEIITKPGRFGALQSLAGSMRRRGMVAEEIMASLRVVNARRCSPPLDDSKIRYIAESISEHPPGANNGHKQQSEPSDEAADDWIQPQPIPVGLLPVPELPVSLIPAAFRGWVADIADRLQVPLEFPAVPAIVGIGSVIGNQIRIRPKMRDDWMVVPNQWGGIVGRPGVMKSPAIAEALKPLHRLRKQAERDHEDSMREWRFEKEAAEVRRAAIREKMKKAAKAGSNLEEFRHELSEDEAKEPTERRYIVNDTTVEKYGELLNENPNGLLIFRDELTGWLRSLDDDRRRADRAFYLEAWNGEGGYTYDRIERGTIKIENITTSILGGIQPGPLQAYLRGALGFAEGDDGLIQRLQMMVYPDLPPEWKYVDRWPETEAKDTAFDVFERLSAIPAEINAAKDENLKRFVSFSPDAQEFFAEWYSELRHDLREGAFEHPALESHFAKYGGLMPSLALIFELVNAAAVSFDGFDGKVSIASAKVAAAWCQFLMAHAKRIYGLGISGTAMQAHTLATHLQKGDLPQRFTARDVYYKGWSGLTTAKAVEQPLDLLEHLGWLKGGAISTGGRPTIAYVVNPRITEVSL